ncbi:MAG: hypothetical protein HUK09_06365 [Bacteroidaceae bacterium]|nr:hypothetical protein [Bacteroidaceae bacterium]
MTPLYVYADFDWLPQPELVGTLGHETIRGAEVYAFEYDKTWLKRLASRSAKSISLPKSTTESGTSNNSPSRPQ